jgi:uncharacterized membrane protein YfcA
VGILDYIFICAAGFIAAAVDSIAGGGGLISLPAIMSVGVPAQLALGTNKFASSWASFTSTLTFAKSKKIYMPLIKYLIPCTLVGASIGVYTALRIDPAVLRMMILVLIFAVAIYTIINKNFGSEDKFQGLTKLNIFYGCLFAFALGFYDGFFGPGTGSFLIFLFISVFGFDFTISAGNAKILNFVSNITSLVLFAISGNIRYAIGIPMALFMILGARVGTKIAINNGAKVIKPIFVTIALVLTAKLLYQSLIKFF